MTTFRLLFLLGLFVALPSSTVAQEGVVSRQEALKAVFQDAAVTRDRVILTSDQMNAVASLARVGMQGKIFPRPVLQSWVNILTGFIPAPLMPRN